MICGWGDSSDVCVIELDDDSIAIHTKRRGVSIEPDAYAAWQKLEQLKSEGVKVPAHVESVLREIYEDLWCD